MNLGEISTAVATKNRLGKYLEPIGEDHGKQEDEIRDAIIQLLTNPDDTPPDLLVNVPVDDLYVIHDTGYTQIGLESGCTLLWDTTRPIHIEIRGALFQSGQPHTERILNRFMNSQPCSIDAICQPWNLHPDSFVNQPHNCSVNAIYKSYTKRKRFGTPGTPNHRVSQV